MMTMKSVDQRFMCEDELNHKIVAKEVIRVVERYTISHNMNNVIGNVCDNVSYMTKSFMLLSPFYENYVSITCTAKMFIIPAL